MEKKIKILSTTDVHGYYTATNETSNGISCLPRMKDENSILIDVGDYFIGSPVATFFNDQFKVSPLVKVANELGYNVMVPGNHDFDNGLDFLQTQVKELKADYVCANIIGLNDELIFKPYTIIEKNGVKVGIIGVVTSYLPVLVSYEVTKSFKCLDVITTLKHWVPIVKEEVDVLLVGYHGGIERNLKTGDYTQYDTGEDEGYKIAMAVAEIDGLICGHQHRANCGQLGSTLIVQPGSRGSHVGQLNYELETDGNIQKKVQLLNSKDYESTGNLFHEEEAYHAWLEQKLDLSHFKQYLHSIEATYQLIDLKGERRIDFLQSFKFPYHVLSYRISHEEMATILECHEIEGLTLDQGKVQPYQEDYQVLTNLEIFPNYRLNKQYINNVFDEYLSYLKK